MTEEKLLCVECKRALGRLSALVFPDGVLG
jgi:hypothetical protein